MTAQNPLVHGRVIAVQRLVPVVGLSKIAPDGMVNVVFCLGIFRHDRGVVVCLVGGADDRVPCPVKQTDKPILTQIPCFLACRQNTSQPVCRIPGGRCGIADIENVIVRVNDGIGRLDDL